MTFSSFKNISRLIKNRFGVLFQGIVQWRKTEVFELKYNMCCLYMNSKANNFMNHRNSQIHGREKQKILRNYPWNLNDVLISGFTSFTIFVHWIAPINDCLIQIVLCGNNNLHTINELIKRTALFPLSNNECSRQSLPQIKTAWMYNKSSLSFKKWIHKFH